MKNCLTVATAILLALSASFSLNAEKPKYKWILGTELDRIFAVEVSSDMTLDFSSTPDKVGLIDAAGNVLIDGVENYIIPSWEGLGILYFFNPEGYARYSKKGKGIGVINKNFDVVIEPQYENLELCGNYIITGMDSEGKGGLIISIPEKKEILQVPDRYAIEELSDDMILVYDTKNDNKPCYLNMDGKVAIPSSQLRDYEEVFLFTDDRAAIMTEDFALGFIDKNGKEVIPPIYQGNDFDAACGYFQDGLATLIYHEGDGFGVIDKEGNVVIPFKYWNPIVFEQDKAVAITKIEQPDGNVTYKYELIDRKGNVLKTDPEYFSKSDFWIADYDEALHKYKFVGIDSKEILPAVYDEAGIFSGGLAIVKINDKWCVINEKGEVLLDNIAAFSYLDLPG